MKNSVYNWRIIVLTFLGWTLFGAFFALQNYANAVYFGQTVSFSAILAVWLICGYSWMFLTPAVVFLAEKFSVGRERFVRNVPIHFLAGSLIALAQLSVFIFIRHWLLGNRQKPFSFSDDFQALFFSQFQADLLIYWIVVGIWHLRKINRRYLERERETARLALEAARLETKLAQARLDALKMQLHPHFLFNTLNSISVLMDDDPEAAKRMLVRLGELLRAALKSKGAQEVALKEELEFLQTYLEIEQVRFQDRLQVTFDVEQEVLDARVPKLILQPLVENAIRHGIAPQAEAGRIRIRAKRENGFIRLSVKDSGAGLKNSSPAAGGIGLKNTRERLEKLYGDRQQFEMVSAESGGFEVKIKIPLNEQ